MSSLGVRVEAAERERIQKFIGEVFNPLHRAEQRRWARAYLWGLLHTPGKKTPRRMAQAGLMPTGAAHGLHQFINSSPWTWEPVRSALARTIAASRPAYAWTTADVLIPKQGEHSVGVHRRLDQATGRTINCQRGLGLFLATTTGAGTGTQCFPVDWNLVLDGAWDWDDLRRRRARIPEAETGRPVGAYVLGFAAGVAAHSRLPDAPWVLNLTRRCDDASGVMAGLARRGLDFVCEVDPGQIVLIGRPSPRVITVGELMEEPHARQPHVLMRQSEQGGSKGVRVNVYGGPVRLAQRGAGKDVSRPYHVLEQPSADGAQSARYWITSLLDRGVDEVLALARSQAAARTTVAALREGFGVLDFEGRSFPGWHHHMTMVSAAYAYRHLYGAPDAVPAPAVPMPRASAETANRWAQAGAKGLGA
ncbi:transposase [Streptomyces sp. NPDC046727]|uniref:IS701 family transposase n=1 Tax=Streptomyces sp. NPDC046727 TaxID=3155373 RepID=UPI0033C42EC7